MTPTLVLARVLCAAVLWMPVTSSSRPAADEREADGMNWSPAFGQFRHAKHDRTPIIAQLRKVDTCGR